MVSSLAVRRQSPVGRSQGFGQFSVFLILLLSLLTLAAPQADAKPAFSAITVDARTGKVISSVDADGVRHPASLTKMMTLYVLFQEMEAGRLSLSSPITISARAAGMAPSKLGVKPGTKITVETAIKALVVKSANDVAAAVGENIAGSESAFADRMTRVARSIGMNKTTFRNASGLPNSGQVTTARDMATLGLRLQRDFPQYYPYFRTMAFSYAGKTVKTHNRLLGKFQGTDGIKTGYIAASGFNLVTSAKRGQKRLVGVVMGGTSGASRDAYMRKMLDKNFPKGTDGNTIAALAGSSKGAVVMAEAKDQQPDTGAMAAAAKNASIEEGDGEDSGSPVVSDEAVSQAPAAKPIKTSKVAKSNQPAQPQVIEGSIGAAPEKLPFEVKPETEQTDVAQQMADTTTIASLAAEDESWLIQTGDYKTKEDATARLMKLRNNGPADLRDKPAFIVTIQKGDQTTFRARFSGFSERNARDTCDALKRRNQSCYVVAPNS